MFLTFPFIDPAIPARVGRCRVLSFVYSRGAAKMRRTRMNTAPRYHWRFSYVTQPQLKMRIDTEEVDGSNPFGPTIENSPGFCPLDSRPPQEEIDPSPAEIANLPGHDSGCDSLEANLNAQRNNLYRPLDRQQMTPGSRLSPGSRYLESRTPSIITDRRNPSASRANSDG